MKDKCIYSGIVSELKGLLYDFAQKKSSLEEVEKRYNDLTQKYKSYKDQSNQELKELGEVLSRTEEAERVSGLNDLFRLKIQEEEKQNIDIIISKFSNDWDFYSKQGNLLAVDLLSKYDSSLVDEINVFQKYFKEGVGGTKDRMSISESYTRNINAIHKILKKAGYKNNNVNEKFILALSEEAYNSIKREKGKDGFPVTRFNWGYTPAELELKVQELGGNKELLEKWKKENGGFINYFETRIKEFQGIHGNDIDISKELEGLHVTVFKPLTQILDKVQRDLGNTDLSFYGKYSSKGTFLKDLINTFIGDPQFVFKSKIIKEGENGERDFIEYFLDAYSKQTGNDIPLPDTKLHKQISSDARKIYNTFIDRKTNIVRRAIKNLMAFYYLVKYDKLSFGYGHITMGMQLASNYLELQSVLRYITPEDTLKINALLSRVGNIGEDMAIYGTGMHREALDDTLVSGLSSKFASKILDGISATARKAGIKDELLINKIRNGVDMFGFSPMVLDSISDDGRVKAAVYKIMEKFGDDVFEIPANRLRNLIRGEYARIGGAVVTSSPLYRETTFTMLDPNKPGFGITSFFMDSFRFLRGWAIAKTLNFGEVQLNGIQGVKLLLSDNLADQKLGKVFLKEFVGFNLHLVQAMLNSFVLYARIQKTNHEREDKRVPVTGDHGFIEGMTNQLVGFEISFKTELENIRNLILNSNTELTRGEQATMYTLDFISKITNFYKVAGGITLMKQYLEMNPGDWEGAIMHTRNKLLGGVFRYGKLNMEKNLYDIGFSNDPITSLGVATLTKEQIADNSAFDLRKNLKYMEGDNIGFMGFGALYDLFAGYILPSDYYMRDKSVQNRIDKIVADPGLRNLYLKSATFYDIDGLYNEDPEAVGELFNQIQYKGVGKSLDDDMYKKVKYTSHFEAMDRYMTDLLVSKGMTMEDIIAHQGNQTETYGKIIVALQKEGPEKMKYVVPYLLWKRYSNYLREYKKETGRQANEELQTKMKFRAIKENLELFDLNNEAKGLLGQTHVKVFKSDEIYKGLGEKVKTKLNRTLNAHLDNVLLATANLKESGTNVSYLTSRIRMNLANIIPKTERGKQMYADYVLKSLNRVEYSELPEKEKVARQAAFLLGITKEGSDILKDNEAFQFLSMPAKTQLANWYYKVSNKMDQYTAEIIGDGSNYTKRPQRTYGKKYMKPFYRKNMFRSRSPYNSGQRPGFNKQFPQQIPAPLRPYIQSNYEPILAKYRNEYKPGFVGAGRPLPLIDEIRRQMIQVNLDNFVSRDLFKGIEFKDGDPIYRKGQKNYRKRRVVKDKKTKLRKTRKGKQYLDPNLASYTDLTKVGGYN